jgi:hypothetical protein
MVMIQIEWSHIACRAGAAFTKKILRTDEGTYKTNERAVCIGSQELWPGSTVELQAHFMHNICPFLDDKFLG